MVKCNRGCGVSNLHWKVINDKYKLFENDNLLHMCNDGIAAHSKQRETATIKILNELGIKDVKDIPSPDVPIKETRKQANLWMRNGDTGDASKCFTINTTANGIALTGDDKHNAIFLPKIAVSELVKALVDFI